MPNRETLTLEVLDEALTLWYAQAKNRHQELKMLDPEG